MQSDTSSDQGLAFMRQVSDATNHLLERLFNLTAKASWFFQSDRDAETVRVIEEIGEHGDLGAISGVVHCLFTPSVEVKAAASRTVQSLLDRLPPERLLHLGDMVSESWGWFIWQ